MYVNVPVIPDMNLLLEMNLRMGMSFDFRGVSYFTGKMMRSTSEALKTGTTIIDIP